MTENKNKGFAEPKAQTLAEEELSKAMDKVTKEIEMIVSILLFVGTVFLTLKILY